MYDKKKKCSNVPEAAYGKNTSFKVNSENLVLLQIEGQDLE